MIDLKFLCENPEVAHESQRTRSEDPVLVDQLLEADAKRREVIASTDVLYSKQKGFGKKIDQASKEERPAMLEKAEELSGAVRVAEAEQKEAEAEVERLQYLIGNIVTGAPAGGEDDFVVLEEIGGIPQSDFRPKNHLGLGESLSLIGMERGVKVSGSRFYFLTGYGTMLRLVMMNLATQKAIQSGFQLMVPPVLARPEIMTGTDLLGAHSDEIYYPQEDDLYLVGTSEVALIGYHSNETIDLSEGLRRHAGWSSCLRRKVGSYGRDTRGILRVHQLDKLKMFSYCPPEQAEAEHQKLLNMEREMLATVEVSYRIIDVAGGDLGVSAAHKFDVEAWVPTQNAYRELTSTSNCTTFQARRLKTRYRDTDDKSQYCATLNSTLVVMCWLAATLENHQQADGPTVIPEAPRSFMMGKEALEPVERAG